MNNTIVSLITAPINAAVAVIRLSGDNSLEIAQNIFSRKIEKPNYAYVGKLINNNEIIDEVVLIYYKAPKSFTGEDVVEISIHGSMLIANEVISLIIAKGARLAQRGEFSSRAYYNNKIDLIQAEAIMSMVEATSIEAKKLALYSLEGDTSKLIKPLIDKLADILSNIEVNIDYPEYLDIEEVTFDKVKKECTLISNEIDKLLNQSKKSQYIISGIKVALVGLPNTGKSSLLNAFLGKNKAIVTNIPGTTRDIVEGSINLNGIKLDLLDTAGIHESDDEVENIGINKSKESLDEAELVLLVLDASNELNDIDKELLELTKNKNRIIVLNKCDLDKKLDIEGIEISAINQDISLLKNKIIEVLGFDIKDYKNKALLTSSRQIGLINKTKEALLNIKELINNEAPFDILSVDMKVAYDSLKEILGEISSLGYDDVIFSKFCVGK